MRNSILLIQGPNLNYLGKREPDIYGKTSALELNQQLYDLALNLNLELEIFYSQSEGEALEKIYASLDRPIHGLIMNPAAWSYAGYALRDCLRAIPIPYLEVHISNLAKRNIHSILAEAAAGVIYGFGIQGYFLALHAMNDLLPER